MTLPSFQHLEVAVVLMNGVGQMAIIAVLFGMLKRHRIHPFLQSCLLALFFAVCALSDMVLPVEVVPGVFVDFRAVAVGLASAVAGLPGAVIAGAATGWYRWSVMGGAGAMAGCAGILIAATAGLFWRQCIAEIDRTTTRSLLALGLLINLHAVVFFFLPSLKDVAVELFVLQTIAALVGAVALGKLLEREASHIQREHVLVSDASSDPLTGLANRRSFEREVMLARSRHRRQPLALLMLDVDHFKLVNDRHGHAVGDEVLRRLAVILKQSLRSNDRVARHGGEEFTILLPASAEAEAGRIAERVRRRIEEDIFVIDGIYLRLTISIGVAVSTGGCDFEDLMHAADKALYQAKANGRNRTEQAPFGWETNGAMQPSSGSAGAGLCGGGGQVVERAHLVQA